MVGPNPYFDSFNNNTEQELYDGMIQESIEIYGEAMYYIPRRTKNFDGIYTEDDADYFDTVYLSTFYIKNVEGFEGQGNFLSKFGLEIRDQVTLVVSNTLFQQDVADYESFSRPREGDLIFFPLNNKVFEITYCDKFSMFFPFGTTPSYQLTCQLFEYTSQNFTTGIPEVDRIQRLSENIYDWAVTSEDGSAYLFEDGNTWVQDIYQEILPDPSDETAPIQTQSDAILDFSELDPFSEGSF